MKAEGLIQERLHKAGTQNVIQVQDTGCGIPTDEQMDIFEPFYRGKEKTRQVSGLGLGLPFSRMLAHALGGDLELSGCGPDGTIFALSLPGKRLMADDDA